MYEQYPEWKETIEAILTDGGYTGAKFQKEIQKLLNAEVQVAKRSELHQFQVIPKRWIVERAKVGRSFICCENRWCFKSFHKHIGGLMISYFTELNIHGVPFSINRTICHVLSKIQIPRDKF
jgi:transposase